MEKQKIVKILKIILIVVIIAVWAKPTQFVFNGLFNKEGLTPTGLVWPIGFILVLIWKYGVPIILIFMVISYLTSVLRRKNK